MKTTKAETLQSLLLQHMNIDAEKVRHCPNWDYHPDRGWYAELKDGTEYHLGTTFEIATKNIEEGKIQEVEP